MPSDGRRKLIILAVRNAIRTATGVDYFFDYTGTRTVTLSRDTLAQRLEGKGIAIRVRDGNENHSRSGVKGSRIASLEVIVEITIVDANSDLVEKMNNVLADLSLVIGKNKGLGGFCTSFGVGAVDAPSYDFSQSVAVATMRVRAEYDYQEGSTR